jgi:hypothetical protein
MYLTAEETRALQVAVSTLLTIDQAVLVDDRAPGGGNGDLAPAARLRRLQVAAGRRRPVLLSLQTALAEHLISLERQAEGT